MSNRCLYVYFHRQFLTTSLSESKTQCIIAHTHARTTNAPIQLNTIRRASLIPLHRPFAILCAFLYCLSRKFRPKNCRLLFAKYHSRIEGSSWLPRLIIFRHSTYQSPTVLPLSARLLVGMSSSAIVFHSHQVQNTICRHL